MGQISGNKAEGRADCVTQEHSRVKSRTELKVKADELCLYIHSFFPILLCIKRVFLLGLSNKKIVGAGCVPVEGDCIPKWDAVNM